MARGQLWFPQNKQSQVIFVSTAQHERMGQTGGREENVERLSRVTIKDRIMEEEISGTVNACSMIWKWSHRGQAKRVWTRSEEGQ